MHEGTGEARRAPSPVVTVLAALVALFAAPAVASESSQSAGSMRERLDVSGAAVPPSAQLPRFAAPAYLTTLPKPPEREWAAIPTTAVGDFTGDGLDDLLVTRANWPTAETYDVLLLVNDGFGRLVDGRSRWKGEPSKTVFPYRIAVADFNADGADDALIADTGEDVPEAPGYQDSLLLSAAGGRVVNATANLPQQSLYTYFTDAADVDADGDIDVYLGHTQTARPQILLNDGMGRFVASHHPLPAELDPPANSTAARFVDVDGDGDADLVVAGSDFAPNGWRFPPNTFVLINDGDGRFTILANGFPRKPFAFTGEAVDMAVISLNADTAPDLAVSWTKAMPYYRGRWLQLLVNDGAGRFRDETGARLPFVAENDEDPLETLELVDINRDGRAEIASLLLPITPPFDRPPPFYLNDGQGRFTELREGLGADTGNTATILDLDGDGGNDIVFSKDALRFFARRELNAPVRTLYANVTSRSAALTTEIGTRATRLRAGRFQVVVRDVSLRVGFRFDGIGGDRRQTGNRFVGRAVWHVTLHPGRVYSYRTTGPRSARHAIVVHR